VIEVTTIIALNDGSLSLHYVIAIIASCSPIAIYRVGCENSLYFLITKHVARSIINMLLQLTGTYLMYGVTI